MPKGPIKWAISSMNHETWPHPHPHGPGKTGIYQMRLWGLLKYYSNSKWVSLSSSTHQIPWTRIFHQICYGRKSPANQQENTEGKAFGHQPHDIRMTQCFLEQLKGMVWDQRPQCIKYKIKGMFGYRLLLKTKNTISK